MTDPWAFGWTQVFTILGFMVTGGITFFTYRGFERWKREKIEEKRIDVALEALSVAYETKYVFDHIRSPMVQGWEMDQVKKPENVSSDKWAKARPFIAIQKRIDANRDYFDRLWKLQPRFMAAFGPETEEVIRLVHQSRRDIEVASEMLKSEDDFRQMDETNRKLYEKLKRDVWDHGDYEPEKDIISKRLDDFRAKMELICRPIVDKQYAKALNTQFYVDEMQKRMRGLAAQIEGIRGIFKNMRRNRA